MLTPGRLLDVHPAELAARFKDDGMLAYVELVQRKEKEIGCDVLTHQKWLVSFPSSVPDMLSTLTIQERSQLP